jgi:nicotinate-nucleotide adenylyltransferase
MVRPPDMRDSLLASLRDEQARVEWAPRLVDVPEVDISSTDIRERVAQGKTVAGQVSPAVETYIREHGLYKR